jgi:FkbM family methyltransferase
MIKVDFLHFLKSILRLILSIGKGIFYRDRSLSKNNQLTIEQRIKMTVSCRDSDTIPKVDDAGEVYEKNGNRIQIMHEGTIVLADAYSGQWMTEVIRKLNGHHEPQEELMFHYILKHVRKGSLMVELGAWWAYYSNWFLGKVEGGKSICIEPDPDSLECCKVNMALNSRSAKFINAFIGNQHVQYQHAECVKINDGIDLPCMNFNDVVDAASNEFIEILHIDTQGAEYPFLLSMIGAEAHKKVRFMFISTHHESISSSPSTHSDCIGVLKNLGAVILVEHEIHESYSGDGLIVSSFNPEDAKISLPSISRNTSDNSLFPNQ